MRTMTFLVLALGASAVAWGASPTSEEDRTGGTTPTQQEPTTRGPTGQQGQQGQQQGQMGHQMGQMGQQDATQLIQNWPEESKMAAQNAMDKYGQPTAVTDDFIVWKDSGPFKYTMVYKEGIQHSFPKAHKDVIEQTVPLQVPVDMYDDLAKFDGSLSIDRTMGTVTSRSNSEAMNFAALNLANEIVSGKRTVEDARRQFSEVWNANASGQTDNEYTRSLMFEPKKDTTDKDRPYTGT